MHRTIGIIFSGRHVVIEAGRQAAGLAMGSPSIYFAREGQIGSFGDGAARMRAKSQTRSASMIAHWNDPYNYAVHVAAMKNKCKRPSHVCVIGAERGTAPPRFDISG